MGLFRRHGRKGIWNPPGGEYVVPSFDPDDPLIIEEPETPEQRKQRIIAKAAAGKVLRAVLERSGGDLGRVNGVLDELLAPDPDGTSEMMTLIIDAHDSTARELEHEV